MEILDLKLHLTNILEQMICVTIGHPADGREIPALGTSSCEEDSLDLDSQDCVDYVAAVVQYLEMLQGQAHVSGNPLATELAHMLQPLGDRDRLPELMRMKVPWSPQKYFGFQSVPQVTNKS